MVPKGRKNDAQTISNNSWWWTHFSYSFTILQNYRLNDFLFHCDMLDQFISLLILILQKNWLSLGRLALHYLTTVYWIKSDRLGLKKELLLLPMK